MRVFVVLSGLSLVCALMLAACSGAVPSSPSAVAGTESAPAAGARLRTLDDPPSPAADAPPAPAPTPLSVIIGIVGSFGSGAFMPNPIQANVGDNIVWTNNDTVLHHIVLDDGTDIGDVAPGTSTGPIALTTPTANFHCTLHPSMVGSINGVIAPPPVYEPPQYDYGYY